MPVAYIGLGSNLGDRAANLRAALVRLNALSTVTARRTSSLYATAAVDSPEGAPPYLNAVAELETTLAPETLLGQLLAIEADLGRERPIGVHNAPRTLDLDLLMYGDVVMQSPHLTLPHPRMHTRRFVLTPLAEIAPEVIHPVLRRRIADLDAELALKQPAAQPHIAAVAEAKQRVGAAAEHEQLGPFKFACATIGYVVVCVAAILAMLGIVLLLAAFTSAAQYGQFDPFVFIALGILVAVVFGAYGVIEMYHAARRHGVFAKKTDSGHAFEVEAIAADSVDEADPPAPAPPSPRRPQNGETQSSPRSLP